MRRFRRFALLVAAVAVAAPSVPSARAADVDPLLPKETEVVMHLNIKQMLDSDLVKKFALPQIKEAMKQGDTAALLEKLGLDPLKDIASVTVGAANVTDKEKMKFVAAIRGAFDAEKIFKTAKEVAGAAGDKLAIVEEGDLKLVKMVQDNGPPVFATVADDKTIVAGNDPKAVAAAATAAVKKEKAKLEKGLTALVLKQDEKATAFVCGITEGKLDAVLPPMLPNLGQINGEQLKEQLGKMSTATAVLNVGKDITLNLTTGMKDADTADGFGVNVGKLVTLGKAAIPFLPNVPEEAKPLLADIAKTLGSKVDSKDVTLSFKIAADTLAKVAGGAK